MYSVRELRHALYMSYVQNRPVYIEVKGERYVVENVIQDSFGDVVLMARELRHDEVSK